MNSDIINSNYPIIGMLRWTGGVQIIRTGLGNITPTQKTPKRGEITHLSAKSLRRLAFLISTAKHDFKSIMTLTYPEVYPKDGKGCKADLHRFLLSAKRKMGLDTYVWFLEFQKRGAPHYHILTMLEKVDQFTRYEFAELWIKAIQIECLYPDNVSRETIYSERRKMRNVHTHETAFQKVRKPHGAKKYALKYCAKPYQKEVPEAYRNVGRFWGMSKDVKNEDFVFMSGTEKEVREYLTLVGRKPDKWDVLPKYIWTLDDNLVM